ncbi:DSD1 family PLP-dependent enzyme [Mitsuaria sp. WAJ17]|uniref:DSD1 family PLP-dependent enzyme n=1 Tax=Mitsuaria sp. WAJ17 TaxID=2761452 RepID=UPI0016044BB8|nr:DSD1 family PLP-dependent enzyme [Mitsuaria sp. WAJ17]MBB2487283.1 DSD1 family PLP-dependent enzyme [Mitsuaria sp. WAJ17]
MNPSAPLSSLLPPLARFGDLLSAVDSPALLLDLDAFERNVTKMQAAAVSAGMALRPHAKAHKCVAIAQAQMRAGAVGICCQKVSEAIPFVAAGIPDILVSNEVVGEAKARLLAELAGRARMSVCVDHEQQIEQLAQACEQTGSRLELLVEINIGQDRCGVADAPAVLRLVEVMEQYAGQLRFKGLQAYQGGLQHVRGMEARREAVLRATERARAVVQGLQDQDLDCETITGGGTGSAAFDLGLGLYTELQPGSYVFMDADYGRNEVADASLRFEHALLLASTVMSEGMGDRVVLDAGLKSLSAESGMPWVWDAGSPSGRWDYVSANDEHGILQCRTPGGAKPRLGEQILLVPGHCDPTLNLHDALVAHRAGRVVAVWAIEARGLSR